MNSEINNYWLNNPIYLSYICNSIRQMSIVWASTSFKTSS